MNTFNYFNILCFGWAAVGIVSRFLIVFLGDKWNKWELNNAYSKQKPKWIYLVGTFALLLVIYTWYQVLTTNIEHSWIIAVLVSLTLIKVTALLFKYEKFRKFAKDILNSKQKLKQLNISVFTFSLVCILMGLFLY